MSIMDTMTYKDASKPIHERVEDLLQKMTLAEKIGQMTQIEKNSITPEDVAKHGIGSVLSGGGGNPPTNNPEAWGDMVRSYLIRGQETRLGIPVIYGVDAVHGHSNVRGTTIFPHNIGLGASGSNDLLERIGRATAVEVAATGVRWNFAPAVSVARDIRWGRTFESFSENTDLVARLGAAYIKGLQGTELNQPSSVLASVKHFVADGATKWGSPIENYPWIPGYWVQQDGCFMLDQGVAEIDEETLRSVHLPPYKAAIEAGARNIMVSYSSWGGLKMHAQKYLLDDVLKKELGFDGFLVSDWLAISQIDPDFQTCVITSINAGLDMIMVPFDHKLFISSLTTAVEQEDVPLSRIDDAVRRILRVKFELGLFDSRLEDSPDLALVGCEEHRQLAREAVRKSVVLLVNQNQTLPLDKASPSLLVAGQAANDIGFQCGGWTIEWMGGHGPITEGTTILEGILSTIEGGTHVEYAQNGNSHTFSEQDKADTGIVVIHEMPYVEGYGDKSDISLSPDDSDLLVRMRAQCRKLVVILISGRPLILGKLIPMADAWMAAWLPGSEGQGIADVLFGDYPFTGKLPFSWPQSDDHFSGPTSHTHALFPFGHGLTSESSQG